MNENERDPRVDAAWRAANRDEPPASVDEAIRAAARRAIESGPRRKRDKHWWYPFAAAATVAVIAVGLLQLTPPEQVTPTIPETAKLAKQDMASTQPPAAAPASAPPPAGNSPGEASNALAPSAPASPAAKKEALTEERSRLAGAMQNERKSERQLDAADKLAPTPEQESARNIGVPAPAPSPAAPAPRSEPFPAERPQIAARRDAAVNAEAQSASRAAAESAPAPAAPPAATSGIAGRVLEQKRAQGDSALAKDALEAGAPKSKTAPRSVEDWIKLIRQLRSEGRIEEASKEIAAFRSAYGERADVLLPQDLRSLAPAAPASAR